MRKTAGLDTDINTLSYAYMRAFRGTDWALLPSLEEHRASLPFGFSNNVM